jgi:hypothetical protein
MDINPNANYVSADGDIRKVLPQYQSSIYISDDKINGGIFHTPANRFYEIIGSKTLLFIDKATEETFKGFDIDKDYFVSSVDEVKEKLQDYKTLRQRQIEKFKNQTYKQDLEQEFLTEYEKIRL